MEIRGRITRDPDGWWRFVLVRDGEPCELSRYRDFELAIDEGSERVALARLRVSIGTD